MSLPAERLRPWNWEGVDITKESIWKGGESREDSIQWHAAQHFKDDDFSVVFDDDGAGEAADLVCMKSENDHIRLALVHCKFSGSENKGARVKDVVEVASQAVRSARRPGKFKELIKHIQNRYRRRGDDNDRISFLAGSPEDLTILVREARLKEVRPEILIIQPGVSKADVSEDQSVVLGAAVAYVKQTLDIDLDIVCSN